MQQELAETRALGLLAWLAGNEDLLPAFMAASGIDEADLRARAGAPEVLAAVLDFLLMEDAWVLEAARAAGIAAGDLSRIRAALPGGQLPDWT